ncbi:MULTISPECIES: hypothetical protein [unclassified Gilliamella]|uniref:hypothetical protein n=1 Tax=unclassified Gilliamella TaxID=2685620 RepID=UPI001305B666|nr:MULTISPECIES: hypothetical protein [unclassified Gilliamella]MWP49309.1 hypothetical protein [Gilliamella sp. Lep-s35]MWP68003.1 hypothetical protein [Gilliamella sp. Lep-s5]MWP76223.1 hypothetical protein [Gilliamella sp. Lep-s21]
MMDVLQDIIGRAFVVTLIIGLLTLGLFIQLLCNVIIKQVKLAVFATLIIGLLTFVGLFIQLLCNVIIKQVKSDKISDEILIKHYNFFKKYKDSVALAVFCYGILYRYGMKLNQKAFDAYKECMIRRNLPL